MTHLEEMEALQAAIELLKAKRVESLDCSPIWRMLDHAHNYISKQLSETLHAEY